jgi:tetratricopeptide (TPR) repeat protein
MNANFSRGDSRWRVVLALSGLVALAGWGLSLLPARGVQGRDASPITAPLPGKVPGLAELQESSAETRKGMSEALPLDIRVDPKEPNAQKIRATLKSADAQLKSQRYDAAIATLNAEQPLLKNQPEAYWLIARALEGKRDLQTARDFYNAALDRDPSFASAYWGYATTSEALGDLPSALGAMRSYLHTEPDADPNRLRIAQARSAIWEWEAKLGRGPWGPTKGIPPGFTESELKRDGRGVGIKMPVPGTEQPDGTLRSEVKSQSKFKIFPRD